MAWLRVRWERTLTTHHVARVRAVRLRDVRRRSLVKLLVEGGVVRAGFVLGAFHSPLASSSLLAFFFLFVVQLVGRYLDFNAFLVC